jgi:hypothetical protein
MGRLPAYLRAAHRSGSNGRNIRSHLRGPVLAQPPGILATRTAAWSWALGTADDDYMARLRPGGPRAIGDF